MNEVIQELPALLVNLMIIFAFFNLFLERKKVNAIWYLVPLIVYIVTMFITLQLGTLIFAATLFLLGSMFFFFRGTIRSKIMVLILFLQACFFSEYVLYVLIGSKNELLNAVYSWSTLMVLILLNVFLRKKTPLIQYIGKNYLPIWGFVSLNIANIFIIGLDLNVAFATKLIYTMTIVVSNCLVFFIFYQLNKTYKIREENMLINKRVEFQETKMEQNKLYLKRTRKLMHDIKKHHLELERAIVSGDKAYALDYLKQISEEYANHDVLDFTGNLTVDSIFYALVEECKQHNIELEHQISINKQVVIDETDLSVLLGSIFDNAVEEAMKVSKDPFIHVTMSTNTNFLTITVAYSRQTPLLGEFMESPSKAIELQLEDNSASINRVIDKYSGIYEQKKEETQQSIRAALPLNS
ncbi:hypothetical protein NRIC_17760 [Enterococcus florum]|uniref:Sensor histidine kinase NatK-like C-terminal domain-containing protein n=1 Tax=Enterococcus florum TaxID=2480627 RepID=A0A4P5P7D1_9ENTE|nr:GHKL domain-containing protein [Enterococcus florum]GCF93885.1 hypothetical protein NRIC_17760 [Enterococcus florum]